MLKASILAAIGFFPAVASWAGEDDPRSRALERALSPIAASAEHYLAQRDCFSCHHQALPALALAAAGERGLAVDASAARRQSDFTVAYFQRHLAELPQGRGVVGGPYTAGYALAGLAADRWPANEVTAALVAYLLVRQQADGRWPIQTHRPPLEDSDFTATALAVRGLRAYAPEDAAEVDAAVARARDWLAQSAATTNEDRTFRLLGLHWAGADPDTTAAAANELLTRQREDGGWAQTDGMLSDAYATGQALTALLESGRLRHDDPACRRATAWLLARQREDGSWLVETRSKPIQDYFESGYPHDESQFISIAAACWAAWALALQGDAP